MQKDQPGDAADAAMRRSRVTAADEMGPGASVSGAVRNDISRTNVVLKDAQASGSVCDVMDEWGRDWAGLSL